MPRGALDFDCHVHETMLGRKGVCRSRALALVGSHSRTSRAYLGSTGTVQATETTGCEAVPERLDASSKPSLGLPWPFRDANHPDFCPVYFLYHSLVMRVFRIFFWS